MNRIRGGGEIQAKILDKNGIEVPKSDYELEVEGDEFSFNFKTPRRDQSGMFTAVFEYQGVEASVDTNVTFLGRLKVPKRL